MKDGILPERSGMILKVLLITTFFTHRKLCFMGLQLWQPKDMPRNLIGAKSGQGEGWHAAVPGLQKEVNQSINDG